MDDVKNYTPADVEYIKKIFKRRLEQSVGAYFPVATKRERFTALAYAVRDQLVSKWLNTQINYYKKNPKRIYYMSAEFLMGRTLGNALLNRRIRMATKEAMMQLNMSLNELEELENDAGLGNGGLGRLAACFLDSMATLNLPAYGYGIRYEFGMFYQKIVNGKQVEGPDTWLRHGHPFEIEKNEITYFVNFGGSVQKYNDEHGHLKCQWINFEQVIAKAFDTPIPGYDTETVNTLRLWSSRATREFNLEIFDAGDYTGAVFEKSLTESISKVLYPNDNTILGKHLRFKQQYFLVSASMQDILRRYQTLGDSLDKIPDKMVIQLNDTHPTLAIPEFMRLLLDHWNLGWDEAWNITKNTFAFTNHTLLPEAMEKWPVVFFKTILPRHLDIIYEINQRFLDNVIAKFPGDFDRVRRMSIIHENQEKEVNMVHLAMVCSFSINGVAKIHSELLKAEVFKDFYHFFPEKFNNKTNGVTPRRWMRKANSQMSQLVSEAIGKGWVKDLEKIKDLEKFAKDTEFQKKWFQVKKFNKERLALIIKEKCQMEVNPDSMFDVHVKRIHEYKRQFLNIMHCIYYYHQIKNNPQKIFVPRTIVFGGKAAPGYHMAKLIINLINNVAQVVNQDPATKNLFKIVFIPNYGVSLAEMIIPGADLSQQISTAGFEASGTGNMKFAMNGALTIGTLDGANIEMRDEIGNENIFIFGKTVAELRELSRNGYNPFDYYHQDFELKQILDEIKNGYFSPHDRSLFHPLINQVLQNGDRFFHLADFRLYIDTQAKVNELYKKPAEWQEKSILNVARMSQFSSDRTIKEYAKEIWKVEPCEVEALEKLEAKKNAA